MRPRESIEGVDRFLAEQALRVGAFDVLDPATLCRRHRAWRYRVVMGPSYRADMWAALEAEPDLSAAEPARRT
jgi:hypothetical protein